MGKSKVKNFCINLDIYPFDIMFSFGETDAELKKNLKMCGGKWEKDKMSITNQKAIYYMNNTHQSLIRLKSYPITPIDYGYLQHEIFHAVTFIMDAVGMKFKLLTSCEAYSYLIQYITTKVYTIINPR